jgi:hypothetical protein
MSVELRRGFLGMGEMGVVLIRHKGDDSRVSVSRLASTSRKVKG